MALGDDIRLMCRFHPHIHPHSFAPRLLPGLSPLLTIERGVIHSHSLFANSQSIQTLLSLWSAHLVAENRLMRIPFYLQVTGSILLR